MNSQLTDTELWNAVVSDSYKAFVVLYNRHWGKLYKTAGYYLKDDQMAKEITQDVFTILWTRRKFLHIENFQKYIHVTARYCVFKCLKAAKLNPLEYIEQYTEHASILIDNSFDDKISYDDLKYKLAQLLEELPARCQQIFWLSRVKNLTNDEIAKELGISKRTVENQITHALKYLRMLQPKLPLVSIALFIIFTA